MNTATLPIPSIEPKPVSWYTASAPRDQRPEDFFQFPYYGRLNQRRLEHLASLGLALENRSVLEVGAGVGDLTHFWLDRGCTVRATDARPENLHVLQQAYPQHGALTTGVLDLENPPPASDRFDVVFCYGLLYHLSDPVPALDHMARACAGLLVLETCVSMGSDEALNPVAEDAALASQAVSGRGCRPTRPWVFGRLRERFPHVYTTVTQPAHEEFPLRWAAAPLNQRLTRAIFVASRTALDSRALLAHLPSNHTRSLTDSPPQTRRNNE